MLTAFPVAQDMVANPRRERLESCISSQPTHENDGKAMVAQAAVLLELVPRVEHSTSHVFIRATLNTSNAIEAGSEQQKDCSPGLGLWPVTHPNNIPHGELLSGSFP